MNKYIREDLKNYHPYHSPLKPYEIKMDANESPYPHHPDFEGFVKDFGGNYENITRYPDTDATELRAAIGERFGYGADHVVCGVGSDQVIDMIIRSFIAPGDKVVMPAPSFSMYQLSTTVNHGVVVEVPLDDEFEYDLDRFKEVIKTERPKLVFLCTPNNPTGCVLDREEVIGVIEACVCPIVVDEAYGEFTGITVSDLVDTYDHLIVLRTFSKSFGLAGLRTGYALACKEMIDAIYVTKPPYNLSTFSQAASLFVLKETEFYMKQVELVKAERERLSKELTKFDFVEKVFPSGTNFILIKVNRAGLAKMLEKEMILIRDYAPSGYLASCVRITVGRKEENDILLKKMSGF